MTDKQSSPSTPKAGKRLKKPPAPPKAKAKAKANGADTSKMATPSKDNQQVRSAVMDAFGKIQKLEAQRSEINASIKAVREGLVTRGLNKQAIKDAERYYKMDDNQRTGYDESLAIARRAIELPIVTAELFPDEKGNVPTH